MFHWMGGENSVSSLVSYIVDENLFYPQQNHLLRMAFDFQELWFIIEVLDNGKWQ